MANYFNKFNRENHFFLLILWEKLDHWLINDNQLNKDEKKYLRTAITYMNKASNSIIQRLGLEYANKLHRDINSSELTLRTKGIITEQDSVNITEKTLEIISDYALVICQRGHYCNKDNHKDCPLFNAFWEANIPVGVLETEGCPYKMALEEESFYRERGNVEENESGN